MPFRSNPGLGFVLVLAGDALAFCAALGTAMLWAGELPPPLAFAPLLLLQIAVAADAGLYGQLRYVGGWSLVRTLGAVWFRCALAVVAVALALPELAPSRALAAFAAVWLASTIAVRFAMRALRRALRQRGRNLRYLVVVGTGPAAVRATKAFAGDPGHGVRLVGFLGEAPPGSLPAPHLGPVRDLERVVRAHVVDEVLVADPAAAVADVAAVVGFCNTLGLRTHLVASFLPGTWKSVEAREVGPEPVVSLTPYSHGVLAMTTKRVLDVVLSATALVVLLPVLLLVALCVVVDSRGPVFFVQWRIGLNGRRFRFPKFRSMVADAEQRLPEVLAQNEMDGPVFKMRRDPRVTRVGAFLRRYSLDELPQLWCVLRGDMSLVGPRPLMPHEIDGHATWQRRRLSMRPGLTCLWQVSGRNEVDFDRWMRLDLEYIDGWSLGLDLRILLRTVPAVLSGRGAS